MTGKQIRQAYLDFMKEKGHAILPSSPIVPDNDPTTLFTGSGMQPMVPYLLGEKHPLGTRIADSQKCFRAEDIEEVGNNRHTTFFEMLGNWSLGDYYKDDQLTWIFEFLTNIVGLDSNNLYVTVHAGDKTAGIPQDDEAVKIWQRLFKNKNIEAKAVMIGSEQHGYESGMQDGRIFYYESNKNWWSRAGVPEAMPVGEPGGPDSEIFYLFDQISHNPSYGKHCHPNCDCGRFMEIGNSVFMAYIKNKDGSFAELPNKNIDFGGGLVRIAAASNNDPDVFKTDLLWPIIEEICEYSGKPYEGDNQSSMRVIADHVRAATHMIIDGVTPGNKQQGYYLRRLLRRSAVKFHQISGSLTSTSALSDFAQAALSIYDGVHDIDQGQLQISVSQVISQEMNKFATSLDKGLKQFEKTPQNNINGQFAFNLFQTYGFPFEVTQELAHQKGVKINKSDFDQSMKQHQEQSRSASAGMFKGGLADQSDQVVKYHTATHLLHQSLRQILGDSVEQLGSNITGQRLRFDFKHSAKLTDKQISQVQELVNQIVNQNLPVHKTIEEKESALKSGALAFFRETYPDKVSVYTIGNDPDKDWFSKELCGGPHVSNTGEIGPIEIYKQKSIGAGTIRIYARQIPN